MKTIPWILGVFLMAGCTPRQPDSMPDDAMRVLKTSPLVTAPDAAMARRSGESLEELGKGYSVFMRKCGECHEPRVPENPRDPSWHPTMVGMSWNAGLTDAEEASMESYLRAAAP